MRIKKMIPYKIFLVAFVISAQISLPKVGAAPAAALPQKRKLIYNGTIDVERSTQIRIDSGLISGLITVRNDVNVSCYLGLPYAEPPIGERRFADPVPPKPWKDTYRAVRQPPICYQSDFDNYRPNSSEFVRELMRQDEAVEQYYASTKSEDCLYLSVFTRTQSNGAKNKTVLVWIHGGAFISGTGNLPFQDYPFLVAHDPDLVVVAVNYRLNVFGFISSGTDKLAGNFGLKDQIMALRWIKQNIGAFGGNPDRVVLWGQSAGAMAIGYHTLIAQSGDRLFSRAILESGSVPNVLGLAKSWYRRDAFRQLVNRLNCTDGAERNQQKWIDDNLSSKVLPCLRRLPIDRLFGEYHQFAQHAPLAFLPNIEDRSLFESGGDAEIRSGYQAVHEHRFTFTGDILMGSNEAEGAQYVKVGPLSAYYSPESINRNFTRTNIRETLIRMMPESVHSILDTVIDMLIEGVRDENNSTEMWNRYVSLVGDMVFVCPDYFFANSFLSQPRKSRSPKLFYYRFRTPVSKPFDCPRWSAGACHTDELQFAFGNPLLHRSLYPVDEQKLALSIMSTWLEFAHRGHFESKDSFVQWKPFSVMDNGSGKGGGYLRIDMTEHQMISGFPGERCEELGEPLFAILESMDESQMQMVKT